MTTVSVVLETDSVHASDDISIIETTLFLGGVAALLKLPPPRVS
jgi:hypothetical protein